MTIFPRTALDCTGTIAKYNKIIHEFRRKKSHPWRCYLANFEGEFSVRNQPPKIACMEFQLACWAHRAVSVPGGENIGRLEYRVVRTSGG